MYWERERCIVLENENDLYFEKIKVYKKTYILGRTE
jgi:hypothetical protein